MSEVLVTGAAGFIGRHLCKALQASGRTVIALSRQDGEIADPATLRAIPSVPHVFHLAGRAFVPDSWTDPVSFQQTNVQGTCNVLEYCRARGARLTYVSSYVYGIPAQLPVAERDLPAPNNPYTLSKILAEQSCEFYARFMGVDVTVIRPFNIFGPGQHVRFLIPSVMAQARAGRPIQVKDLSPKRDYLYVEDLVGALLRTLDASWSFDVFNVGSGVSLSVREVVDIVQDVYGTDLPVVSDEQTRPYEIQDVYADITRAGKTLGWAPSTSFKAGIERMVQAESEL